MSLSKFLADRPDVLQEALDEMSRPNFQITPAQILQGAPVEYSFTINSGTASCKVEPQGRSYRVVDSGVHEAQRDPDGNLLGFGPFCLRGLRDLWNDVPDDAERIMIQAFADAIPSDEDSNEGYVKAEVYALRSDDLLLLVDGERLGGVAPSMLEKLAPEHGQDLAVWFLALHVWTSE